MRCRPTVFCWVPSIAPGHGLCQPGNRHATPPSPKARGPGARPAERSGAERRPARSGAFSATTTALPFYPLTARPCSSSKPFPTNPFSPDIPGRTRIRWSEIVNSFSRILDRARGFALSVSDAGWHSSDFNPMEAGGKRGFRSIAPPHAPMRSAHQARRCWPARAAESLRNAEDNHAGKRKS